MSTTEETQQPKPLRAVVAIAVAIVVVAGAILARRPVYIAYYEWRMKSALEDAVVGGPGDYSTYEHYRDTLVELGYYVRAEFRMKHIGVSTKEAQLLWKMCLAAFPESKHVEGSYRPEPGVKPATITVWDRPERVAKWREFIEAHDVPDFWERFGDKRPPAVQNMP